MTRRKLTLALVAGTLLVPGATLLGQQPAPPTNEPTARDVAKAAAQRAQAEPDEPAIAKIKEEGEKNSQVMKTLGYLSDVIGPRLTASPNMKRANEWTRDKLTEWGLKDAHLEAWGPFGRGWTLKRFSAQVVEPQNIPLIAFPKAWSPGTDGPITAPVVHLDVQKEADFDKYKGKLKGAIVLTSPIRDVKAWFTPPGRRLEDKDLLELANAPEPRAGQRRRPGTGQPRAGAPGGGPGANPLMAVMRRRSQFLLDEGAAVVIDPSPNGDGGTLFVAQAAVPGQAAFGGGGTPGARRASAWDKEAPKNYPQVTCAVEHYNRLVRMIQAGETLTMTVDIAATFHDGDLMGYNTVAEIPGTDLKDEVVMLGGHMDSWHSGTGATDNAAGVSVCMEAVRILQAAGLKPRRTIRVALWSGEEQGLLGSKAYVTEHFGGRDTPNPASTAVAAVWGGDATMPLKTKADFEKISAYFNLDNGTGKVRGIYTEGNEAVRPLFRRWLQPFRELGASTITASRTGGTDHMSFDAIGIPGFQFIQDPGEYDTRTHHSNQDVFDRIQADDMKQASVVMAAFVFNTANLDSKLPRKPAPGAPRTNPATAAGAGGSGAR